jgi:hypothetical protein
MISPGQEHLNGRTRRLSASSTPWLAQIEWPLRTETGIIITMTTEMETVTLWRPTSAYH